MITIDRYLGLEAFDRVVRRGEAVSLSREARQRVAACRAFAEELAASGEAVYGLNTGFGRLATVRIPASELEQLQRNLLLSHAIGVGEPFPLEVVRGMLLLRLQSLALGFSGVRPELLDFLILFLNQGITPVVPSQGSVGASGDLAPLAHMALPLIGEGEVDWKGERLPGGEALRRLGVFPLELKAKEGLALINGTQAMASLLALILLDAQELLKAADLAVASSVEALKGSHRPFDEAVTRLRPHPGAIASAANIRALLADSEIERSHASCGKVQDAYSLRAAPQVHGASRDALAHVREVLEREFQSVTDNPLLLPEEGRSLSAGNFHGQPLALAADYAGIAIAELADISERRIEQMLNPALSGLPAFLAEESGLNSGLMISQYTAAALVSENKILAHPASVDSIPTSANQEDHVSMGTIAARKAGTILEQTLWVLAIELASAAQALDFHTPLKPGRGVQAIYARIREEIPHLDRDRYLQPELFRLRELIRSGELRRVAEERVGTLN
jgi:histidine ammonia-lyase